MGVATLCSMMDNWVHRSNNIFDRLTLTNSQFSENIDEIVSNCR